MKVLPYPIGHDHDDQTKCTKCQAEERWEARRREGELFNEHWAQWTHEAFDGLAPDVGVATTGDEEIVRLYSAKPRQEQTGEFRCRFRRGFVAEITCTLAAWMGERCQVCEGNRSDICSVCCGTGVTGRHGPRLVRATPAEYVRLSDREPWDFGGTDHQHGWWRDDAPQVHNTGSVPVALWKQLENYQVLFGTKAYPTRQAAFDALSSALLAWARKEPV